MKQKKTISILFSLVLAIVFSTIIVNSTQNFNINQTSFNQEVQVNTNNEGIFSIENTGNETLNLTIEKNDLTNNSNTIILNLNQTSIINFNNNTNKNIKFTYSSGTTPGIYTGSITVINNNNNNQNTTINVQVEVKATPISEASVEFENFNSILTMTLNVDDSSEKKTFHLKNNGNLELKDIEIKLDDLDSSDDRINNDDIELNGEAGDDTLKLNDEESNDFSLLPNETYNLKIDIDIPSNLDVDDYKGDLEVSYLPKGASSRERKTFTLKVITESDDDDTYIDHSSLYVKNGILTMFVEPGENTDDYEFTVINDASYDVNDITFELDSILYEEDSSNTMSTSILTFDPTSVDIDDRDDEDITLDITIPDNQPTGKYTTDINLISSTGKELDSIKLEIEVIGDVYVKSINYDDSLKPGDNLDVEVVVRNKGSNVQRNVKITGSLFDVDYGNSDIHESSSNFLLESDSERKEILRFKIPEDASDGAHTLEIKVNYDDNEIFKIENVDVNRAIHNIKIDSYGVNPTYVKCENQIYTFMKVQNLGKYDEDIKLITEIVGTDIKTESSTTDLGVDEIIQKSSMLDISSLSNGTYKIIQKMTYSGGLFKKEETTLKINTCNNGASGISIYKLNDSINVTGNYTQNSSNNNNNTMEIFGQNIEKTTVYLSVGVFVVFALIIFTLFLL